VVCNFRKKLVPLMFHLDLDRHSSSGLDPNLPNRLDPDTAPHKVNANPKHFSKLKCKNNQLLTIFLNPLFNTNDFQ
jgi:hypothetical protein